MVSLQYHLSLQLDIYLQILLFLPLSDILSLFQCCSELSFRDSNDDKERVFHLLIERDIARYQFEIDRESDKYPGDGELYRCVASALDVPEGCYSLIYRLLYKYKHRILGYYHAWPVIQSYGGDLLKIAVYDSKLALERLPSSSYVFSRPLQIYSCGNEINEEKIPNAFILPTSNAGEISTNRSLNNLHAGDLEVTFPSYTQLQWPKIATTDLAINEAMQLFQNLNGRFYECIYGPHGKELFHMFLHEPFHDHPYGNTSFLSTFPQFCSLKIRGDPNVPANQLSFCVDISHKLDVNEQLSIPRLLTDFVGSRMVDMNFRRHQIVGWFNAIVQINVSQSTWEPSWISAECIVYDPPYLSTQNRPVPFSLVYTISGIGIGSVNDYHPVDDNNIYEENYWYSNEGI